MIDNNISTSFFKRVAMLDKHSALLTLTQAIEDKQASMPNRVMQQGEWMDKYESAEYQKLTDKRRALQTEAFNIGTQIRDTVPYEPNSPLSYMDTHGID